MQENKLKKTDIEIHGKLTVVERLKMKNIRSAEKQSGGVAPFFEELIKLGVISENEIEQTDDGFSAVKKSLSSILAEKGVTTFQSVRGITLECDKYFDDWYFYAVKSPKGFVYSLFKLREQEYDMYAGEMADADSPGVTVSFISFSADVLLRCLNSVTQENVSAVCDEINRVVASSRQRHHKTLKKYFCSVKSKGAYLIAELYLKHILSYTYKGFIIVPQKYEEIYAAGLSLPQDHEMKRLPNFIDENNTRAGTVVCDHEKIYIKDPQNPTIYEKYAILATHTADTSFNCFAAEVRYHALFLTAVARIRIPFFGICVYESAIRADLSVDDGEFEGNAPYHKDGTRFVKAHEKYHGDI